MRKVQSKDVLRMGTGLALFGIRLSTSLAETALALLRKTERSLERTSLEPNESGQSRQPLELEEGRAAPVVAIEQSVTPNHVVCLEDCRPFKMLKRHLRTAHGLSPRQYREKWGLPADHPLVAPEYAAKRSATAKKIGLGKRSTKRGAKVKQKAAA
jgi:predicted transcriptional regulator